jgi:hypothetical protein
MKAQEAAALSPGLVASRYDAAGHLVLFKLSNPAFVMVETELKDLEGDPYFEKRPAHEQINLDGWNPIMDGFTKTIGKA